MGRVSEAMRRAGGGSLAAGSTGVEDVDALDAFVQETPAPPVHRPDDRRSAPDEHRAAAQDAAHAAAAASHFFDTPGMAPGGGPGEPEGAIAGPTAADRKPPIAFKKAPRSRARARFDEQDAPRVGPARKVVIDTAMAPGCREQYRRLAAALHHAQLATGLKVVMVSSAVPSEGKTLTSSNLALTLSESYRQRVLLIDADFRRPSLHTFFHLDGMAGLTETLAANDDRPVPLRRITPTLSVLPAGHPSSDPMAGLISARMQQLIAHAREEFTWVVIDTPPVGLLTDANLLAAMVDGTLLVVKAGATPYPLVQRAVEALGADRLLGVVLNQAAERARAYGYYADYYAYSQPRT